MYFFLICVKYSNIYDRDFKIYLLNKHFHHEEHLSQTLVLQLFNLILIFK